MKNDIREIMIYMRRDMMAYITASAGLASRVAYFILVLNAMYGGLQALRCWGYGRESGQIGRIGASVYVSV